MPRHSKGFTLVELSIVMVIIALLISGVIAGQTLMRTSELKAVIANVNDYKSAISQFNLRYEGMPGDIADATDYWGGATNGDGNGIIGSENTGSTIVSDGTEDEPFSAVHQLALSEMVSLSASLNGTWGSGFVAATGATTGNVPEITSDVLFYIKCCSDTDAARADVDYNNHIAIFSIYSGDNDYRDGVISPIDALNIDKKMDDGFPDYGYVTASGGYNGTNYTINTPCFAGSGTSSTYQSANATYKDENGCQMQFAYDWD